MGEAWRRRKEKLAELIIASAMRRESINAITMLLGDEMREKKKGKLERETSSRGLRAGNCAVQVHNGHVKVLRPEVRCLASVLSPLTFHCCRLLFSNTIRKDAGAKNRHFQLFGNLCINNLDLSDSRSSPG